MQGLVKFNLARMKDFSVTNQQLNRQYCVYFTSDKIYYVDLMN